jgi:hypothetical protein
MRVAQAISGANEAVAIVAHAHRVKKATAPTPKQRRQHHSTRTQQIGPQNVLQIVLLIVAQIEPKSVPAPGAMTRRAKGVRRSVVKGAGRAVVRSVTRPVAHHRKERSSRAVNAMRVQRTRTKARLAKVSHVSASANPSLSDTMSTYLRFCGALFGSPGDSEL